MGWGLPNGWIIWGGFKEEKLRIIGWIRISWLDLIYLLISKGLAFHFPEEVCRRSVALGVFLHLWGGPLSY